MTRAQKCAIDNYTSCYALAADGPQDLSSAFGRAAPLVVDVGPGNGASTLALATAMPEYNVLAVEVYPAGIGSLLLGIVRKKIDNIRIIRQDINVVLARCLEPECIDLALSWFPDPWPKKRHHKRRLVDGQFLELLTTRLKPGGRAWFATDCKDYAESVLACLAEQSRLVNLAGTGHYAPRPKWRIPTRYECRAHRAGHTVYDLALARTG